MIYKDRNIYRKNKSFKILIVAKIVENSLQRLKHVEEREGFKYWYNEKILKMIWQRHEYLSKEENDEIKHVINTTCRTWYISQHLNLKFNNTFAVKKSLSLSP